MTQDLTEIPENSISSNWFWYFIEIAKNSFLFNNSSFQACIGKRRSGKSIWCLCSACAVDPDITEENICFSIKELKAQLNERTETAIIWEEAGTSAYSRDFMDERNKLISKTLQVYGYRKIAIWGNFQHLKYLDGDIRLQLDSFIKMKAVNAFTPEGKPYTRTFAYPYMIVTDYIQEPLIAPFKVARDGTFQPIGNIPVPQMEELFQKTGVSKSLYRSYLKKKDEYFKDIGEPEKQEEEELFSKKELKTLTRTNMAFINLATRLINDEKITKTKIANFANIPVSTLNVWIGKKEEAGSFMDRVYSVPAPTPTTKNFLKVD